MFNKDMRYQYHIEGMPTFKAVYCPSPKAVRKTILLDLNASGYRGRNDRKRLPKNVCIVPPQKHTTWS